MALKRSFSRSFGMRGVLRKNRKAILSYDVYIIE
jgi:hypothetical protein